MACGTRCVLCRNTSRNDRYITSSPLSPSQALKHCLSCYIQSKCLSRLDAAELVILRPTEETKFIAVYRQRAPSARRHAFEELTGSLQDVGWPMLLMSCCDIS